MPETPEQLARIQIDAQLSAAGWTIQDIGTLNLQAARGVAVREKQSHGGPADYILFVDGKALGIIEAKKEGTTLSGVAEQSARYTYAHKGIPQRWADPLPFTYEHLEKRPLTTDPVKTLTNLISLVRHTVDPQKTPLAPFPELVETRYQQWLVQQQGVKVAEASSLSSSADQRQDASATPRFTPAQIHWLDVIKNYVALNGAFATDDQDAYLDAWQSVDSDEGVPRGVARKAFGGDPKEIIEELNNVLVA